MILPAGHEEMTDDELVAALVNDGVYDIDGARAAVAIARGEGIASS